MEKKELDVELFWIIEKVKYTEKVLMELKDKVEILKHRLQQE